MPIALPSGFRPAPPLFEPTEVLTGTRVTRYRFDLLDNEENLVGEIAGVEDGSVDWTSGTAIKAGGSIQVQDTGQVIDWLNCRIRPMALVTSTGAEDPSEYGLGVYLASAPVEDWSDIGRSWKVELLDKLSILDSDIVTDSSGNPVTYVAPIGANVLQTVADLIAGVGEASPAILPDTKTLTASMTWDVGTSVLQVVNDLLEAAGYTSLYTDGMGQFRTEPYVSPANRTPVYQSLSPFTHGEDSLMSPDWERDRDIYSIPNRYVAVAQGDGAVEGLVAVEINDDPLSPFSFTARGRWVTRVVTGVEATSQADLQARAKMGLAQASSVTSGLTINHVYLPALTLNAAIRFVNPDAGLDMLCYVTQTTIQFDPTALCKSEIREAVL